MAGAESRGIRASVTLPKRPDFLIADDTHSNGATDPSSLDGKSEAPDRLMDNLSLSSDRQQQAADAGVKVAKRGFYQRLGGALTLGLMAVGLVIAGAATGGVAWMVAGGMVGAAALRLSADTTCAGMVWRNEIALSQNERPPYSLPMGADSVANLAYKLCPNSWSSETRGAVGRWASALVDMTLQAANGLLTGSLAAWPMVAVGVGLVAANHGVQALLRSQDSAEDLLNNAPVLHELQKRPVDAYEGALPEDADGQQRIEKLVEDVLDLNIQVAKMVDGDDKQVLTEDLIEFEQGVNQQIEGLTKVLEKIDPTTPSGLTIAGSAGMALGMVSLDVGVKKGLEAATRVPGVDFTSSLISLTLATQKLRQVQREHADVRTLLGPMNEQLKALTMKQRAMQLEQSSDDVGFDVVIEDLHLDNAPKIWGPGMVRV
jgi:hypothetical protein